MLDRPTIALCIPAYNAAHFLPRLLGSAAAQARPFDEILVYDDCSTDDTGEVAEKLGARVIKGEVNRGCAVGKNVLARASRSEWLHFHDADDELAPGFMEAADSWMTKPDCPDVVLFAYEVRTVETGESAIRTFDDAALRADPTRYAICEQINSILGLYRREPFLAAGGYDEDPAVLYNEDVAVHLRLAMAGLSFAADPRVVVINHWQRGSGSMSSGHKSECVRAQYRVLEKAVAKGAGERYSAEVCARLWKIAGLAAAFLDWDTAERSAALAQAVDQTSGSAVSSSFGLLLRLGPKAALRIREYGIRLLKPGLRRPQDGYPPLPFFAG